LKGKEMGLFTQKRKVSTEDFCTAFYDESFSSGPGGVNFWSVFGQKSYEMIAEADPRFEQVNVPAFISELLALRLEVCGVAWLHNIDDKFAPRQCAFTQRYLEQHGRADIWEMMLNYNHAIAKSITGGHDPNRRMDRAQIVFLNSMRNGLFEQWVELGHDPQSVARVANRILCEKAWKSNRAHVYLSFALTDQLNCELNEEARGRVLMIIQGFYAGATEAIREVTIE